MQNIARLCQRFEINQITEKVTKNNISNKFDGQTLASEHTVALDSLITDKPDGDGASIINRTSQYEGGKDSSVADSYQKQLDTNEPPVSGNNADAKSKRACFSPMDGSCVDAPDDAISLGADAKVAAVCDSNQVLLWRWLTWHVAQHCVQSKLRTSLGKPQDTFMLIEGDGDLIKVIKRDFN